MPTRTTRPATDVRANVAVQQGNGVASIPLPGPARLRAWARSAAPKRADITLRIVGRAEGRRLNARYRGRDYATNVLSFPYGRLAGRLSGDIVLCAPVIAREAREQGKSLDAHFAHLVIHGVLHLRGHDHEKAADAERMERLERAALRRLGYPDPYA